MMLDHYMTPAQIAYESFHARCYGMDYDWYAVEAALKQSHRQQCMASDDGMPGDRVSDLRLWELL